MNVNSTVFHYRGGVIMMNVVLRQVSLRMRKTKDNTVAPGGKTTFRNMSTCTEKARDETLLFSSDTNSKKGVLLRHTPTAADNRNTWLL